MTLKITQGHWNCQYSLPIAALVLIDINLHTKYEVPRFTYSKDIMGSQNLNRSHVNLTTPI